MIVFWYFVFWFAYLPIGDATPLDLRFKELNLCFETKITAKYRLEEPPKCNDISAQRTTHFQADVFPPPPAQHVVEAISCSIISYITTYTYFFFGATTETSSSPKQTAVAPEVCTAWVNQRITRWGRLRVSRGNHETYVTNNYPTPAWKWCASKHVKTTNAIMSKTQLSFDILHSQAQHPFDSRLTCEPSKGYCQSRTAAYIFTPFQKECFGAYHPVKKNTTILSHSFSDRHLFQAPEIDLAFSSLVTCPPHVEICYKSHYRSVRCTTTHFIIASTNDNAILLNLEKFSTFHNASTNDDPQALQIAQAISSLGNSLDFEIRTLREAQLRLQCRNTRVMLTNLRAAQFINPSAALSVVLNRQAFATIGSSTLNQLACVPVRGVLKPSLWVGRRLAARPIIEIEYQNKTRVAQLTTGGYLRWDLRDFMPKNEGFLVFKIDNRDFVFKNGTLIEEGLPNIIDIGLPTSDLSLPVVVADPSHLADSLEDKQPPPLGLDYLHSALSALVELNHVQLTSMGINAKELANFQDRPITEQQQHFLLSTISDVFNRVEPMWLRALRMLAYAWGVISTIILIIIVGSTIRNCGKGAPSTTPDKSEHSPAKEISDSSHTTTNN